MIQRPTCRERKAKEPHAHSAPKRAPPPAPQSNAKDAPKTEKKSTRLTGKCHGTEKLWYGGVPYVQQREEYRQIASGVATPHSCLAPVVTLARSGGVCLFYHCDVNGKCAFSVLRLFPRGTRRSRASETFSGRCTRDTGKNTQDDQAHKNVAPRHSGTHFKNQNHRSRDMRR